jgi:hypothetical protein
MPARRAVNQLGRYSDSVARFLDTALEYVANAEFSAHILYFHRLALVGEGGVAGDDKQVVKPGQARDDVLGDTIGEKLLRSVATHVGERQESDGGLVGGGLGRWDYNGGRAGDAVGVDRLDDALQGLGAKVFECETELVANLAMRIVRNANAARFGDASSRAAMLTLSP